MEGIIPTGRRGLLDFFGEGADEVEQAAAQFRRLDARKGLGQFDAFGGHQEAVDELFGVGVGNAFDGLVFAVAFEEVFDRGLKGCGNVPQFGRTDPVGAAFVFLNLLEGKAYRLCQFFLAHAQELATHAYPAADVKVDRMG